ncbi:hypothetical protein [Pseudomonas corrugata]|uniref:hypothetical protein n=1 Tax=Pseudomonas corrugata TaxID=47879 RepID=UPI001C30C50A|nr:hypothetical protein [Pseudomonas corrugata]
MPRANLWVFQAYSGSSAVPGKSSEIFVGPFDLYERDVLPPRALATGTLGLYAVHFRRTRKTLKTRPSLRPYQEVGKDGQKIAGHTSVTMTNIYQRDHAKIAWSEATPYLNISEITG